MKDIRFYVVTWIDNLFINDNDFKLVKCKEVEKDKMKYFLNMENIIICKPFYDKTTIRFKLNNYAEDEAVCIQ